MSEADIMLMIENDRIIADARAIRFEVAVHAMKKEIMILRERVKALEELRSPLYDRAQRYHENDDFIDPRDNQEEARP